MPLNDSQVLGVLKSLNEQKAALVKTGEILEAYLQAKDTLSKLPGQIKEHEKAVANLKDDQQKEREYFERQRQEHRVHMEAWQREEAEKRQKMSAISEELAQSKKRLEEAVTAREAALSGYDKRIRESQKELEAIRAEIDALKKKFAA